MNKEAQEMQEEMKAMMQKYEAMLSQNDVSKTAQASKPIKVKKFPNHVKSRVQSVFYIVLSIFMAAWCMIHFMRVGAPDGMGDIGGMIVLGMLVGFIILGARTLLGRIRYNKAVKRGEA